MSVFVPRDSYRGILIGPVMWFVYFLVAYLVTGTACTLEYAHTPVFGWPALRVVMLGAGVITLVVIGVAFVHAFHGWRENLAAGPEDEADEDLLRHRFIDLSALLLCGASLVGTLWLMATVLINPIC